MKRLLIIRHAKSDHGPQYKTDFERPLNSRGRKDAAKMARELAKYLKRLDGIWVSSARRTMETAAYFVDEFDLTDEQVVYTRDLYLPSEGKIWEEARKLDPKCENVAVFTHNFAAEDLLNRFRSDTKCPTCSIIELHFDQKNWINIKPSDVRFISHKYPKLYV